MNRLTFALAGTVVAMASARMCAAEPSIPAAYISEDTMMIVRIDLAKFNSAAIKSTLNALVDANALKAAGAANPLQSPFMTQILAQMPMMDGMMGAFTNMGATSTTIVMSTPEEGAPPNISILMPASTAENAQQLAAMMGSFQMMGKADVQNGQNWVVISPPMMAPVGEGGFTSGATRFNAALSGMEGASISIAMLPTDGMMAQIEENMDGAPMEAEEVIKVIKNSKWIGLSAVLGAEPNVTMLAELADDASADKAAKAWTAALDEMVKAASEEAEDWDEEEGPNPSAMANMLRDAAKMQKNGSKVRVLFDAAELKNITTQGLLAAHASGMDLGNFNPMGGGF